ncbi:MAG TPA: hypothetical protein VF516_04270, partial [Kofleriaceae bacterium]
MCVVVVSAVECPDRCAVDSVGGELERLGRSCRLIRDPARGTLGGREVAAVQRDARLQQRGLVARGATLSKLVQRRREILPRKILLSLGEPRFVVALAAQVLEGATIELAERAAARRMRLRRLLPAFGGVGQLIRRLAPLVEREVAAAERRVDERIAALAEVVMGRGDRAHPVADARAIAPHIVQWMQVRILQRGLDLAGLAAEHL